MIIGTLYTVDFKGVEEIALLDSPRKLSACMDQIILVAGLTRVADPLIHHFSPQGLTYVVILSQSHIAAHTWPEYRYMTIDFFTCGDPLLSQQACEALRHVVACDQVTVQIIERSYCPR